MVSVKVLLNSLEKVKAFVSIVGKFDADMQMVSDKYVVDAKSIMGLFSMNLLEPMTLVIKADNPACVNVLDDIRPYVYG